MATITLNEESVQLVEQERETFRRFTEMAFPQCVSMLQLPRERRFIGMLPASFVVQRRREGAEWDEPFVQVALWNLHDLGVGRMSFGAEAAAAAADRPKGDPDQFIRFDQAEETDMARGEDTSINYSTVSSGRAFIAALNNVIHRVFQLNGEVLQVGIQPRPELEKVASMIHQARQQEEGLIFATARTLGSLVRLGRTSEDVELRCAMELLTNMGCTGVSIDPDAGKMTFTLFDVMAAMSSGLLQGMGWDQLKEVRKNVETFQKQLATGEESRVRMPNMGPVGTRRRRR